MSYILKGFVSFTKTIALTQSTIASIGELSSKSQTYSRNKKLLVNSSTAASYALTSFISKENNLEINIPANVSSQIFSITEWIANNQSSGGGATSSASLVNALNNNFSTLYTNITCGNLILSPDGYHIPAWVKFTILNLTGNFTSNVIKVWYSNTNFELEYDEFEAIVIPPIENIEQLFSIKPTLEALIRTYNDNIYPNKINLATIGNPYTTLVTENFTWKEPQAPTRTLSTRWTLVIYGNLSNSVDAIKVAIREYIAANSPRPESDWRAILPDIFINTEFYIVPKWINIAISQVTGSQYSPYINFKKELDYIKNKLNLSLTNTHIDNYSESFPVQYKSLCCLAIPGLDNRDSLFSLYQIYNDFVNVPTTDQLYSQMSNATRTWISKLIFALNLCETFTTDDIINVNDINYSGFKKYIKGNILYISFRENGIDYHVATKNNTPNY